MIRIVSFLILSGCNSVLQPEVFQKMPVGKDIYCPDIVINGYQGTAVLPFQRDIELEISTNIDLKYFILRNGHQTRTKERDFKIQRGILNLPLGWDRRLRHRDHTLKFTYTPNKYEKYRPLQLEGVDDKARITTGYVDWNSHERTLSANVYCDGVVYPSKGTTICASHIGDDPHFEFPVEVKYTAMNKECDIFQKEGKYFSHSGLRAGICLHLFKEKTAPFREHRLTTIVCNKMPVRQ